MNDIVNSGPAAPGPSSAPATPSSAPAPSPQARGLEAETPPEVLEHLASGDDVETYAEQRREDTGEFNRNATPAERNYNRHQRARHKIERLQAENAALKAEGAGPRDANGKPDDVAQWAREELAAEHAAANGQQPTDGSEQQQPQETREQYEERLTQEIHETLTRREQAAVFKERQRMIAATAFPDFGQVLAAAPQVEIPDHIERQILASPYGPIIQYGLAHPAGQADFVALLNASPKQQERMITKWETMIEVGIQQSQQRAAPQPQYPQRRTVTQARPPVTPLKGSGGAAPGRGLDGLANADDVSAYAKARLSAMKTKR